MLEDHKEWFGLVAFDAYEGDCQKSNAWASYTISDSPCLLRQTTPIVPVTLTFLASNIYQRIKHEVSTPEENRE